MIHIKSPELSKIREELAGLSTADFDRDFGIMVWSALMGNMNNKKDLNKIK